MLGIQYTPFRVVSSVHIAQALVADSQQTHHGIHLSFFDEVEAANRNEYLVHPCPHMRWLEAKKQTLRLCKL